MEVMKILKTETEYEKAMATLSTLLLKDPKPDSKDADRIELLALLIEKYEQEFWPVDLPDPIEAIKFRMDQMELKNKDLIPIFGSSGRVSEVLTGKRSLTLRLIRALHRELGIPAEVLLNEPGADIPEDSGIEWTKFPIAEMHSHRWFGEFTGSVTQAREQAEELMLSFLKPFRTVCPALFRKNDHIRVKAEVDGFAMLAWQARVISLAKGRSLQATYKKGCFGKKEAKDLVRLSAFNNGPLLAREYLSRFGIHLIITPHLKKTYLDGAAMSLADGTPVVGLTLRYDRLDNFWFTLLHEIAHVILHFDEKSEWYIDDLKATDDSEVEIEADKFAREILITTKEWQNSDLERWPTINNAMALAHKLSISPAIVAGRYHYEIKDFKKLSRLVGRGVVKKMFSSEV